MVSPLPPALRFSIGSLVIWWHGSLDARMLGGWVAWSQRPQHVEPVGIWYPRRPQSSDIVSIMMVPESQLIDAVRIGGPGYHNQLPLPTFPGDMARREVCLPRSYGLIRIMASEELSFAKSNVFRRVNV